MSFTTIYCVGGTERFEWRKCLPVATLAEANALRDSIERGGRKALVHRTDALEAVGLPETFAGLADEPVVIQEAKQSPGYAIPAAPAAESFEDAVTRRTAEALRAGLRPQVRK